CQQSGSLPFTF
nr:immunoglobulin light chain junction region [Macaca mulatta]